MWCKMTSQLTAEQQQMSSPCDILNKVLSLMAPMLPPQLSGVPWNLLTTGVILLTIIMFTMMPLISFMTYMIYCVLLNLLVLKHLNAVIFHNFQWQRRRSIFRTQ